MSPSLRRVAILGLLFLLSIPLGPAVPRPAAAQDAARASGPVRLVPVDRVVRPGEPATLVVRARRAGGAPAAVRLVVTREGSRVGVVAPGSDGRAALEVEPPGPGVHRYRISGAAGSGAGPEEDGGTAPRVEPVDLVLAAPSPGTPVLLCGVLDVLTEAGPLDLALGGSLDVGPRAGAVEALERLAERFAILHVSRLDEGLAHRVRTWLDDWDLPTGPALLRPLLAAGSPLEPEAHVAAVVDRLDELDLRPAAAVARDPGRLEAYREAGVERVVRLGSEDEGGVSWGELADRLMGD